MNGEAKSRIGFFKCTVRCACMLLCAAFAVSVLSGCACSTSIAQRRNDESATLYVGHVGSSFPTSFMPWLSRDGIAPTVASMLYNTLFSYDDETGGFAPLLAKSWCYVDLDGEPLTVDGTYSGNIDYDAVERYYSGSKEDYMAVRIELFDNVFWTDGEKLTVEDVYYSFDVATDNALSNHAGALAWTADLCHESSGGRLVRQGMFTYDHPDLSGTYPISKSERDTVMYLHVSKVFGAVTTLFNTILILPEHLFKPIVSESEQLNNKNPKGEYLKLYQNPVGCGAWMLNREETNAQTIVLDRNPNYHLKADDGSELYKIERIRILLYLDSNTAVFALRKGYIDILDAAISTNFVKLMENEENIYLSHTDGSGITCLVLNVNPAEPFDNGMKLLLGNKDFRRALALAIDQSELIEKTLDSAGKTASCGLVSKDNALLYETASDILGAPIEERLSEANALLDTLRPERDSDGYRLHEGKRISFEILASPGAQDTVAYLQRQFARIGLEVRFKAAGSAPETTYLYRSDFDMTLQTVILSMANADVMYRAHFVTKERSSNYGKFNDDTITDLIDEMRASLNRDYKISMIKRLQTEIAEAYYKLPLYSADLITAARTDRFSGFERGSGGVFGSDTLKNLKRIADRP